MGNRTTTQKSPEREIKQSKHLINPFQILKELPVPLFQSQCVLHKHELLICGGWHERACYSYHTLKNEYKLICKYPSDVYLDGHCVVKLVDDKNKDNNQITLLSFGGLYNHTLVMKYVSIWSFISNKSNKLNNYNQWIPFKDNRNHPIIIGKYENHYYQGARAMIGGSNNKLLFITYFTNNISVFDLNTFQFIKHDKILFTNIAYFHCFVPKSENGQGQEMMKKNQERKKQNYQMLLFCKNTGLSIEYDEDSNTFQFHQLPICDDIAPLHRYAYVCINDIILFFGGWDINKSFFSKFVYKYSIGENKLMTFENTLPIPLGDCVAILNENDTDIHIIGGLDNKNTKLSTHMKTKVRVWDPSLLVIILFFWIKQIYFTNNK
ncbi:hypothetical protein RFI_26841 [Reticulomyxa filosa]|uniref:Kelch motif family protein n=1 Tax=Reticulomyxa filosa TaxID=46433 RepID=X6MA46_RETFI|nr:hypothetical protein RFI_26841 [Reticulomyxa filosa]|eukprot:ETO10536.1 hypothetical protein RFI_26841 [Reticulomyxa filosa]